MGGEASSKLMRAAKKMVVAACSAFSRTHFSVPPPSPPPMSKPPTQAATPNAPFEQEEEAQSPCNLASKNVCAICLEALSYSKGSSPRKAIFTAQCSHAFHLSCISSNVRHGSVSCPICRAHWTHLPRNINPPTFTTDPIFRILDDSIATLRVQRRSLSRAARYDDDDPIDPHHNLNRSPLRFSLIPIPQAVSLDPTTRPAYLSLKLTHPPATDMVLVASPNGPHLRLLKQCMSLVVFSLQPTDRLAIVTYSSAASRVFPLRRMTSYGKRTALQLIDRLFYMGQADPVEGLSKGVKILQDRMHRNPHSCILHLSDSPTRSCNHTANMQVRFPIHRFHVGFGFGASNGFVMHEFEEFLRRLLGGAIREVQLRVGQEGKIIRIGELSGGEERRILLDLRDSGHVCVGYSYVDDCIKTGESIVCVGDKRESEESGEEEGGDVGRDIMISSGISGRSSCVESWDYHDPYMARRWAKHLHAYRL